MGFPEQLKKARLTKGYTQQQVADLMCISKSTYCGYETGKRQPDVKKIKQLSNILNTSGDILLETNLLYPNQNSIIDEVSKKNSKILFEKQQEFLNIFNELSPALQNYLIKTAKDLLATQLEIEKNKTQKVD